MSRARQTATDEASSRNTSRARRIYLHDRGLSRTKRCGVWHARWNCSCDTQSISLPLPRHLSPALLLKTCSFHKLGGAEHWAGRGSVQPATLFRRNFNCLCARTAIDFGSEASEQSTVVHKEVYRNSPHDLRKSGRHSNMQPYQF